jgi:hypothetical protein
MRYSVLALIGYTTFTLCIGLCPMNMSELPMQHADSNMHMAAMDHGTETLPCENCEAHTNQDVTLASTTPVPSFGILSPVVLPQVHSFIENISSPLQTYLAAADPPIASTIVQTIVLRT